MSAETQVQVGEVRLDLQKLERIKKRRNAIVRRAMNRAAKPMRQSVISNAQKIKRFGYLAKSIRNRSKVYNDVNHVLIIGPSIKYLGSKGRFGPRSRTPGAARLIKPYKYAGIVERGTRRSTPKPWLKPAFDRNRFVYFHKVGKMIGNDLAKMR